MKKILFLILLFATANSYAQNAKVVSCSNYITYYTRDNDKEALQKAKDAIDEAAAYEGTKDDAKTWYYYMQVYGMLMADKDYAAKYPEAGDKATEAAKKIFALDTKNKYTGQIKMGIKMQSVAMFNASVEAYKAGDYKKSYENSIGVVEMNKFMQEVDKGYGIDTAAYLVAAYSAEKINKQDTAFLMYEYLYNIQAKEASVYQSLARMYKEKGDNLKSSEVLNKGLELFPDNQALKIDKLNTVLSSNDKDAALKSLKDAVAKDPNNPELYYALGVTSDNLKLSDEAINAYKKAIEIKPTYFDANYNLGALYYNQAIELNKIMNDLPYDKQAEYEKMEKERNAKFDAALPYFEKALQIEPKDFNTKVALKEIYAKIGKMDKSEEMRKLIEGK